MDKIQATNPYRLVTTDQQQLGNASKKNISVNDKIQICKDCLRASTD